MTEPRTIPPQRTALGHGLSLTAQHGDLNARPDRITADWLAREERLLDLRHEMARGELNDQEDSWQ